MEPLVSVIVPVFNVYPYIHEALDSVIGQTYRNLEIILIDDGSTDGSGEVCDEYALRDPRVCVVHQDNLGLSAARNIGLDSANGEIFAFMDPDDAFHCEFVEKTLSAMIKEDADMALCKYVIYFSEGKMDFNSSNDLLPRIEPGTYDRKSSLIKLVESNLNVSVWNKLYKRNLWDSVRFSEGHVYEDTEVTYKICSCVETICVLPELLYLHRKRPGSITMVLSQMNIDDAIMAYIRTEAFISENTPDVFSDYHVFRVRQSIIQNMFLWYYKSNHVSGVPKREFRAGLRQKIIETGDKYNIGSFCFRIRLAYGLVCKCPLLFDVGYPFYRFLYKIRRLIKRS